MIEEANILGEGLGKLSETTRLTQSIYSKKYPSVVYEQPPILPHNGFELSRPAMLPHPFLEPRAGSAPASC
jgi:hypothetical protein